ncbi:MAG: type II secretion system protein [Verrucomicrobiales bacterium]
MKTIQDSRKKASGFGLVELLVVIAIIAVISALGLAGFTKAKEAARMAKEVAAARTQMTAYLSYASDHNGRLLPGIDSSVRAEDRRGMSYSGMIAKRYPARLAPALNWEFEGSVCVNQSEEWADNFYMASVFPAFGINATFVGGWFDEREPDPDRDADKYGHFCIRTLLQADSAGEQLVFASAWMSAGVKGMETKEGHYYVLSPNLGQRRWGQKYDEDDASVKWGYVHPRYGNRAVAAFLDGGVRMLGVSDLQDMRYWAKGARQSNDPNWVLVPKE